MISILDLEILVHLEMVNLELGREHNDQAIIQNENGDFVIDNQVDSYSNYISLQGRTTRIEGRYGGQVIAQFIDGGASELNYNGTKKFETTGYGVTVFGTTQTQQLNVTGVSTFQNNVHLLDDDKLQLGGSAGTHDGLEIYHDSSNSYITDSGSGNLLIGSDNDLWITNAAGTENKARFTTNGGVNLYYDNSKKFETTGYGVTVYGTIESQQLSVSGISTLASSGGITTTGGDLYVNDDLFLRRSLSG